MPRVSLTCACVAVLTWVASSLVSAPPLRAATPAARAAAAGQLSAPALYADAMGKEAAVRKAMDDGTAPASVGKAVRTALAAFEAVLRRYPTSGYCDDALWRAAQLALDASTRLKDPSLRPVAHRYLNRLASEYPSSKFAKQAAAAPAAVVVTAAAAGSPPGPVRTPPNPGPGAPRQTVPAVTLPSATPVATSAPAPAAAPAPGSASNGSFASVADKVMAGPARLLAIHRSVLPDVVRLTLDIDREVPFRQDRLSAPDRIIYDLASTISARSLADRTLQFDSDTDIIRRVWVGARGADTVRVIFDASGVAHCSASPLYGPYRLVIDCVRSKPAPVAAPAAPAAEVPAKRPKPLTPATFARKPAPAASAAKPPAATLPVPRTPATPTRPPAILTARLTAPFMGLPPVLYARSPLASLAAALPSGPPSLPASQLAAVRLEMDTPPALAGPQPATSRTRPLVPAPAIPARNLDGSFSLARQLGLTVSRVVIDPGHGGQDPGAKGAGTTEAALVLDIALRLEALLQREPDIEVILTRRTDEFVPLEERTAMANRAGADLFLSIHANASAVAAAAGVETYYLNFATTANGAAVAARENAVSRQPMHALPEFVKAIAMNGKLDESRDFATHVQRALVQKLRPTHAHLRDLGVKQAPFVVLIGATMPSVLAEVSFLTNVEEGRLLQGPGYRQRIAEGLFTAVQRYQTALTRGRSATGE